MFENKVYSSIDLESRRPFSPPSMKDTSKFGNSKASEEWTVRQMCRMDQSTAKMEQPCSERLGIRFWSNYSLLLGTEYQLLLKVHYVGYWSTCLNSKESSSHYEKTGTWIKMKLGRIISLLSKVHSWFEQLIQMPPMCKSTAVPKPIFHCSQT